MAKIQLNGKISIKSKYSLLDLLKKYKLSDKKLSRYNGIIVPKINFKKIFKK